MQDSRGGYRFGLPKLSKQTLKDQLTHILFYVTAYHEVAGSNIDQLMDPYFGSKIKPGQTMQDVQGFVQNVSLSCLTGLKMPALYNDWKMVFLRDDISRYNAACELHDKFQADLRNVSAAVKKRNKTRKYSVSYFDPEHFECSISL